MQNPLYHNARIKTVTDKDGTVRVLGLLVARTSIFRDPLTVSGRTGPAIFLPDDEPDELSAPSDEGASSRSELGRSREPGSGGASRARGRVFDLIAANPELDRFVTLTLDYQKIDRYSYPEVIRKMNVWLDNRVRRQGLRYVIVPEHHKDGAIHFHGCFNAALRYVPSGHKRAGKPVYNIPDWDLGFSTAQKISDGGQSAVAKYVSKYITKGMDGQYTKVGGRWYLHGGKLAEPRLTFGSVDYQSIPAEAFPFAGGTNEGKYLPGFQLAEMVKNGNYPAVENLLKIAADSTVSGQWRFDPAPERRGTPQNGGSNEESTIHQQS